MKKIIPILLLALFLFNCFGYRLIIFYMESHNDRQLEEQLDNNNFDESNLITLKVPVAYIPYYNGSKSFERVDGQIEIQGILYKFVKRRIYNDSLELLCIPNATAMKLQTTKNEIFKFVNDLQPTKKADPHSRSIKVPSIGDYISNEIMQIGEQLAETAAAIPNYSADIPSCYSPTTEHPPQHC